MTDTRSAYQLVLDDLRVGAEEKLDAGVGEVLNAGDERVLVVKVLGMQRLLGPLDRLEHERLAVVVSVGADAQVDLLGVGVALEGVSDAQNGIWRRHLDIGPPRAASSQ